MPRYGYILLDEHDDDMSRQAMQLDTIGSFTRIFVDRHNKDKKSREQRRRLLSLLEAGDVVYVAAADRFCGNLKDFLDCYERIQSRASDIVLLEEALDSRSAAGKATIRTLCAFNQIDFVFQSDSKKAGIRKARASGRRIGRPPVAIPPGFRDICKAWSQGQISGREAIIKSGLRSTSFYKKAAELGFQAPKRQKTE